MATNYIDRNALIEHIRKDPLFDLVEQYGITGVIESFPTADVQPVVRCKDCRYWKDRHVRCPDGRERQYLPEDYEDIDGNKILIPYVTVDVGINVGSQCLYESNRGWACDKTVFRNADDYCSRAEKRTSSYESWWGICDGWYALESGD